MGDGRRGGVANPPGLAGGHLPGAGLGDGDRVGLGGRWGLDPAPAGGPGSDRAGVDRQPAGGTGPLGPPAGVGWWRRW